MKIFVVLVTAEASPSKVSQEAYKTFKDAEHFILSRSGCLKQINSFTWRDEDYTTYEICEVSV